ncbi:competence protein CoiA [Natrialbaceae archaeon A-CW1-1]
MPFIAVDPVDNRPRIPVGVSDDEEVQCPVCNDPLRVRDGASIARHFYHPPDHSCSGESALHLRMKAIAVEKLKNEYPDASIHVEFVTDDIPRRADVFVEFDHPRFPLGNGIAVEVQYRNEQKDLTETTASYLAGDTSVIWLFEENYVGTRPEYDDVELPAPIPAWPYSIPHGTTSSPEPSPAKYLGITESDLIAALPNHADDQVSLAEFPGNPEPTENPEPLPAWSREKDLHLNLSIASPGVRDVYHSWLQGKLKTKSTEHHDEIEERRNIVELENRPTHFSHRFNEGPGDTFEFSIAVRHTNAGHLTIRKIVDGTEITIPITDDTINSITDFVLDLCYELTCIQISTPTNSTANQPVESTLRTHHYTISHTGTEAITVELTNTTETLTFEIAPPQIQPLLDLWGKIQLWYDYPTTGS